MARKRLSHKEMKALVLKVVADCKALAEGHIRGWQPVDKNWSTIEGAVYLRLSDNAQVAVEKGSLEQQIHIAISEAEYRSEQERINYRITEFYIEPGITGRHDNRPEFIRLQHNISLELHSFVIIKEISRLARDVAIWKRFVELCQSYDCEICIRGLPFNPNNPAFILQLDQMASIAEFESRTTSKRIKESNHSALLTSGKFNGHYPLLGFDAVKNEHSEHTGIYKPNKKELKQVEWIMSRFLRADRYKTLLDWCKEKNIKSKQGEEFGRTSIRTLLTNPRYVGKWYRNKHNAGKRQSKLMPYDRYTEVKLNHGCVIDEELWQRVQDKIKDLDESRARGVKRCYPLSGLLVFNDGSGFVGSGAWGNTCKSTYYYNKTNNLRVRTEIFESEAEKVLQQIIENSSKFQESIADFSARKENSVGVVERKISEIDTRLGELSDERRDLDERLSFLLSGGKREMAESFRGEYERQFSALKNEEQELESRKKQLQLLQKQIMAAQDPSKNEGLECINKAIDYIGKKDFVSLKSAYRKLFQKVIVNPLGTAKVNLKFVFNSIPTSPNGGVDANCISNWMVGASGVEPETPSL